MSLLLRAGSRPTEKTTRSHLTLLIFEARGPDVAPLPVPRSLHSPSPLEPAPSLELTSQLLQHNHHLPPPSLNPSSLMTAAAIVPLPLPASANPEYFKNFGREVQGIDLENISDDQLEEVCCQLSPTPPSRWDLTLTLCERIYLGQGPSLQGERLPRW